MNIDTLLNQLKNNPNQIVFADVMQTIDNHYEFSETAFTNGEQHNRAGENSGSCKVFSFALLQKLDEQQTLALFGEYYREDVLKKPQGDDHQNIRQFIEQGFAGISFSQEALTPKT